jgi:hypothetical protein
MSPEQLAKIQEALQRGDFQKLRSELDKIASTDFSQIETQLSSILQSDAALRSSFEQTRDSINAVRQATLASAEAMMDMQKQIAQNASTARKRAEALLEAEERNLERIRARVALGLENANVLAEQEAGVQRLRQQNVLLNQELDKQEELFNKATKEAGELFDTLTDIASGDILGGLKKLGKQIGSLGTEKLMDKFGPKLKEMGTSMLSSFTSAGQGAGSLMQQLGSLGGAVGTTGATAGASAGGVASLTASLGALSAIALPLIVVVAALVAVLASLAVVVGIGKKIFDLALNVANARRELELFSGASEEFTTSVMMGAERARLFGVSVEELGAVTKELTSTFTDFTMMSNEAAQATAVNAALMTKLGMSAGDVSKSYQNLNKVFGQTGAQADTTMRELEALARDISVSPAQMGADFAAAGSQLAKLGADGPKAFRDLAVAAKITGFEVSRLLQITEKFDTFDGAAEQVGKLNAALGGNFVNAMELMTETEPAARFGMIRDAILDAGKSFDTMSYYERNFFAQAAGLNDVGELALMLKGNMESLNGEIGKTSADYEAAAKRARNLQSVQEALSKAFDAMIPVIKPVIEFIEDFAKSITENVAEDKQKGLSAIAIGFKEIGNQIVPLLEPFGQLIELMTDPAFADSPRAVDKLSQSIKGLVGLLRLAMDPIYLMVNGLSAVMLVYQGEYKKAFDVMSEHFKGTFGAYMDVVIAGTPALGEIKTQIDPRTVEDINAAAAGRAAAPTYATNNAINSAVSNTANYYGSNNSSTPQIIVTMDGRKVGEGITSTQNSAVLLTG